MLSGARIETMVTGGPAEISGQLEKGDEIVRIDGVGFESIDRLHLLLRGSDAPGSALHMAVKKASTVSLSHVVAQTLG